MSDADNRNIRVPLFGLDERGHFKKFIQGSVAARKIDVSLGGVSEHYFAAEEIVKTHSLLNPGVDALFEGELDV